MNSPVVKRSIVIAGHKTSVSLEDAFSQARLDELLDDGLETTEHAWQLMPDGGWVSREDLAGDPPAGGGEYQQRLMRKNLEAASERRR